MNRRNLIALLGGAAAWPLAAAAQSPPARLALLGSGSAQSSMIFVDALKQGLADNGLVEGRDYVLDLRWAEGQYARFPALAADVAKQGPRVILATTIAAVRAAQRASPTTPVVMTSLNDPVAAGLIASLGRPGGNTTGMANLTDDLTPKVLDILRGLVPTATRVVTLFNPANPSNLTILDKVRAYASGAATAIEPAELKAPEELERLFGAMVERRPHALLVINDASILDMRERIMGLALQQRLPTASSFPEFTDAGALVGYGPPRLDLYRRSAYYVKRILDGAKPADLPVEQPTRIELSVNLKTARALDITIPDSFLARADRVIE
jgi:putative ABC transport system substrate-binding protein